VTGRDLQTLSGNDVLRVVDGHVVGQIADPIECARVTGHVRVTAPPTATFIPGWALDQMREYEPPFGRNGVIPLLDLEVVEPGLVRVQGVWAQPRRVIVVTEQSLSFMRPGLQRPISFTGPAARPYSSTSGQ
jgi:hypothetical protein